MRRCHPCCVACTRFFELAKSDVYVSPIKNTDGPFTLTKAYRDNVLKVAKKRVALAGARLAKLLDAALK
jgi:hypothetical protein